MGKVKKQIPVSNAQPAPQKNGGVTKAKNTVRNQGPVQRPIKPAPQPLLVAIKKVPYFPLVGPAKIQNLKTAYIQYHALNLSLLGMHQFVCSKGKGKGSATDQDIDMQVVLRVIKLENIADPLGFLSLPMSEGDVNKVISVRNKTAHLNLNEIDQIWQTDLPALVLINKSVNQPVIAQQIKDIVDQMKSGNFDGLVKFSFVFAPGFSHAKAFGLSMIVYGVFLRFFAEPLSAFLGSKVNLRNITVDLYANLNYILDQINNNQDFISPGGASRNDAQVFQTGFECRNDNAHGAYTRASTDYKLQLDAVVAILQLINSPAEALEVQAIVDRLVILEAQGATKFYFGERRVSLARLEMVIIRPARGSPDAKVEFAMKPKVTPTPKIWTCTLEVDYSERGQWSNWAMVIRPVGSTTRFNFPQVPKTDERRRSWKSKYAAVAFPAITEERRDDPSRSCARIRQCVMDEKMDIPPVHLRTGTNFRLGSTDPKIIIHYCIGARAGPRGADPRVRSTVNCRIPKMISALPPTCTQRHR
ncbi:hypothetical protein DAPPUDRAFT_105352 [Daphnia pulex]|uniref:Uncharacterized protein n=1 Tax=Daphnia pulex TaxID=6669 RepID=E9GQG6_DAPPU|nr:hypothetical protein DAPPUDRAFT_105352 [Daphnia pulex]|eukprot:EFX78117.1 hypothetical protein DAPPUDRAFT_105352 [Daphnia pulex]